MSFQNYALSSATNQIRAILAGKHLLCSFKRLSGSAIPPGKYKLSAPMKNMVYGQFVLLSPVSRSLGWIDNPVRAAGWIDNPVRAAGWVGNPARGADWIENPIPNLDQEGIFVLVGKPITGRNAILITSGFADFISALAQTRGSEITVS